MDETKKELHGHSLNQLFAEAIMEYASTHTKQEVLNWIENSISKEVDTDRVFRYIENKNRDTE